MNIYLKRILRILFFFCIFLYLFIHLTYVFREPLSHTREHLMGFYSEKRDTVDVAVIGTSCTFSAIAPMQLWEDHGIAAYNFCTNVMLENTMRYAIREIRKTQSPSLYIIDIAPFMNGFAIVDSMDEKSEDVQILRYNVDGLKLSKNRIDLINEVVLNKKRRPNYYFDLMYYHSNSEPELEDWNWNRPSAYKGYSNLQVDIMFPDEPEEDIRTEPCALSDGEMEILNALLDEIGSSDLNVLFIVGPYWPVAEREEVIGKAEYLKSYLTDRGYAFLDLHEHLDEIGMKGSEDYSMDYNHYTITGAIKNTKYLGAYISENYDIPDRRDSERYDKWRREYKEWTEEILPDNIEWSNRMRQEYLAGQSQATE